MGSDPTVGATGPRKGVAVLSAVSHDGDSFYTWSEGKLTADHGIAFLRALEAEFGEHVEALLDRAPYFYAKDLWETVSDDRSGELVDETNVERVVDGTLHVGMFRYICRS